MTTMMSAAPAGTTVRALVQHRYGGPDVLRPATSRASAAARPPGPRLVVRPHRRPPAWSTETAAPVQWGSLGPVIHRPFALDDGAAAVRYVEDIHASGKVIITVLSRAGPSGARSGSGSTGLRKRDLRSYRGLGRLSRMVS